jgi:hypothetical protein
MQCPICLYESALLREVHGVAYFKCLKCGSIFAHPDFMAAVEAGAVENYRDSYWEHEISAARERSFGAGVVRMAEMLRMARIPGDYQEFRVWPERLNLFMPLPG